MKKILVHLGLATQALTVPEDPVWRMRGPPDALFRRISTKLGRLQRSMLSTRT